MTISREAARNLTIVSLFVFVAISPALGMPWYVTWGAFLGAAWVWRG